MEQHGTCGSISNQQFNELIVDLVQKSDRLSDGWKTHKNHDRMYVCKRVTSTVKRDQQPATDGTVAFDQETETEADQACLRSETSEVLTFDYHILYSESYSVPVLYFNVYTNSGSLLPLDAVWNLVPELYRARLLENRWSFITQTEHPYLNRPFYQLHPCNTEKLMSVVPTKDLSEQNPRSSLNYLITWLSVVGPVVNLKIPLDFGL